VAQSKAAIEQSRCADAVRLAHSAAHKARESMMVWYNLQITMMRCDTTGAWDFSMESPAPPQLLPPSADDRAHASGECQDLVVVTAASSEYFERARNLVGSLHVWQPGTSILLYDLGLDVEQAAAATTWRNVELRRLGGEGLPHYVSWTGWETSTYAFKPLVVAESLQFHACVLWLDSGIELRQVRPIVACPLLSSVSFSSASSSSSATSLPFQADHGASSPFVERTSR
jgi:hypothetical protein